jgi:two-component system NtrC family sensor kinase
MQLYAKQLIYSGLFIGEDTVVAEGLSFFRKGQLRFAPVLSTETIGKVVGFVSFDRLLHLISTKYGYALYQDEKIGAVMETEFLSMDVDSEMMDIVSACMNRTSDKMYDDIVITENGFYSGLVSIKDIVRKQMEHIVHKNRHIDLQNQTLKEADYQVKQSESKYKLLFENGVNAVMVIDLDGTIAQVNTRFTQLSGYTAEETEGRNSVLDLFHAEDRPRAVERFLKIQKHYFTHTKHQAPILNNIEFRMHHKNGSERALETSMRYLPQTKQILCSFNDITEKKYFEERLRQSEKLSAIGSMLTGISHELNNQLTPILGYVDLMLSENHHNDRTTLHRLQVLRRCATTASNIVSTLLRYAKPKHLNLKPANINELISDNAALLRYHEGFHRVKFQQESAENLPLCKIDEHQIGQVLLNMFINAMQAMEISGGLLKVTTALEGDFITVSVSDTGKGISQSNIHRVFEPFFTTKSPDKGTGLGLSVSYSIVRAHGGDIHVESHLGKGTTFVIRLPLSAPNEHPKEAIGPMPQSQISESIKGPYRILLIEDDDGLREMAEDMLKERIHCTVISVADGRAALDELNDGQNVDLILSDLRMPHLNGYQLYDWIVKHRSTLTSRIIFITGDTYDIKSREFFAKNELPVVYKPFELGNLIQTVKRKLEEPFLAQNRAEASA